MHKPVFLCAPYWDRVKEALGGVAPKRSPLAPEPSPVIKR
jgi:hypothetical protein